MTDKTILKVSYMNAAKKIEARDRKQQHIKNLRVISKTCQGLPFENDWYYRTQRIYLKRRRMLHLVGFLVSVLLVILSLVAFAYVASAEDNQLGEILNRVFIEQQAREAGVSEQEIARARLYGEYLKDDGHHEHHTSTSDAALFKILDQMIEKNKEQE